MVTQERERPTLHIVYPDELPVYAERFFLFTEPLGIDGHRHEYSFRTLLCVNNTAKYRCAKLPPERLYVRGDLERARNRQFRAMALAALRERYDMTMELDYPAELPEEGNDERPFPWQWLRGGGRAEFLPCQP